MQDRGGANGRPREAGRRHTGRRRLGEGGDAHRLTKTAQSVDVCDHAVGGAHANDLRHRSRRAKRAVNDDRDRHRGTQFGVAKEVGLAQRLDKAQVQASPFAEKALDEDPSQRRIVEALAGVDVDLNLVGDAVDGRRDPVPDPPRLLRADDQTKRCIRRQCRRIRRLAEAFGQGEHRTACPAQQGMNGNPPAFADQVVQSHVERCPHRRPRATVQRSHVADGVERDVDVPSLDGCQLLGTGAEQLQRRRRHPTSFGRDLAQAESIVAVADNDQRIRGAPTCRRSVKPLYFHT
jgi:hypothetical protein